MDDITKTPTRIPTGHFSLFTIGGIIFYFTGGVLCAWAAWVAFLGLLLSVQYALAGDLRELGLAAFAGGGAIILTMLCLECFKRAHRLWSDAKLVEPPQGGGRSRLPLVDRNTLLPTVRWLVAAAAGLALLTAAVTSFSVVGEFGQLVKLTMRHNPAGVPSKGNLGAIRSALSIYYGDLKGRYPTKLESLTLNRNYLGKIPRVHAAPHHPDSIHVVHYSKRMSEDSGHWGYAAEPGHEDFGTVWIDCTHTDSKGPVWNHY